MGIDKFWQGSTVSVNLVVGMMIDRFKQYLFNGDISHSLTVFCTASDYST